jgi:DNA repair protein RecN (Recombination protein N)
MIRYLRIRNLATIEDVRLDLEPGFSVLTGETGAGKSIIIDSLRLVCGEKGSADLVRAGAAEATIEAVAEPPGAAERVVHRSVAGEGSGKAYLDGVLVPVRKLKEEVAGLIDVYGQNDHVFLLQTESHLEYLDAFAGATPLREETAGAAQELRRLIRQRDEWTAKARERASRLDFLEFQIRELEKAGLKPGEETELLAERHILKSAEKIRGLVDEAYETAYGGEASLVALLGRLQTLLSELSGIDPSFREMSESTATLGISVRETADALARYRDGQDASPERLEELEARLSVIETFKRKYGAEIEDIASYLERLKAEREDLVRIQDRLAEAEAAIAKATVLYLSTAERLSAERKRAAAALGSIMEKEIGLLGMKKARFEVGFETRRPAPGAPVDPKDAGLDAVEFLISPNPGEPLKSLRRIASGGELSRIMLALKAVGKDKEAGRTLVFDEIDAGIGGKTAECVAQKLRDLARRHQVLCITHLPQIASFAAHHFRIDKRVEKERTFTTVKKLGLDDRVEEIARLMSGSRVTEAALANAREMLRLNSAL